MIELRLLSRENMDEAHAFARSFGHVIEPHLACMLVYFRGKLVGYTQFWHPVIGIPNWHTDPKVCSPRAILEGGIALREWVAAQEAGPVIIAVGENSSIPESVYPHVGFKPFGSRLYIEA